MSGMEGTMTERTYNIGTNADGSHSICRAKPENVGKGRCHHTEHRTMTGGQWRELAAGEAAVDKPLAKRRASTPLIDVDGIAPMSERSLNAIERGLGTYEDRIRAEYDAAIARAQSDSGAPVDPDASRFDDDVRAEVARRLGSVRRRRHAIESSPDPLADMRGVTMDIVPIVHGIEAKRFVKDGQSYWSRSRIAGHDERGLLVVMGPDKRKAIIPDGAVDEEAARSAYLERLRNQENDIAIANVTAHSASPLTSAALAEISRRGGVGALFTDMSRHMAARAESEREHDGARVRAQQRARALTAARDRILAGFHEQKPAIGEFLEDRRRGLALLEETHRPTAADRRRFEKLGSKAELLGTRDGAFVVREHTDANFAQSDDYRVWRNGDVTRVSVIGRDGEVKRDEHDGRPLTFLSRRVGENSPESEESAFVRMFPRAGAPTEWTFKGIAGE
jgi:hypothetical protein